MSQQEDDLRALAKIMDLIRGLSILVVVTQIYWYCHNLIGDWVFHAQTMKILNGLNEAGGLYNNLWNANGGPFYCWRSHVSEQKVSRMRKSSGGRFG